MPAPAPTPQAVVRSGLFHGPLRTPVALEGVDVEARAVGPCCRVVVRQRYRNREQVPLELVYVFPLDEGAAVCGFEATVDGTRVVGQVKEREQAFADYDDAMAAGHGAFLLDEERADVFTASLGNVRPGAEVVLAITYVTHLMPEGPALRFMLPTTVSPRYAPAQDRAGVGPTPAEALNPPTQDEVPYRLSFRLDVDMPGSVRRIESPSHPITVETDGARATVRLTQRDAAMDRDLVVIVSADGLDAPHAMVERTPLGFATVATLLPAFPATTAAAVDVVFLVDRSGSMSGTSIAEVRNALVLCLRGLTAGCRFDIVGFGSTFESLFGESVAYDEAHLQQATAAVEGMEANLGGTEVLPALQQVLERPRTGGPPRQVVLLTDGEVTNTDAVIALARQHAGHARIFTFGIGAGASAHLVRAVARATGGAAEFIAPGERIEAKVLRQFRRVLAPALTDVRVQWPSGVTGAPEVPPAVFDGERLVVYGLSEEAPAGEVRVTGTLAGAPLTAQVVLPAPAEAAGSIVGPLAARARIRELEEHPDYLSARGSRQQRGRSPHRTTEEILRLALAFQLVSRDTSFVAIEQRDAPVTDRAQLRRIPIALTSGWGGVRRRIGAAARQQAGSPASVVLGASHWMGDVDDALFSRGAPALERDTHGPLAPPPAFFRTAEPPPHVRVVRLQRADGSWRLEDSLLALLGASALDVPRAMTALAGGDDESRARALATAIAVAWLEQAAPRYRDEWGMAVRKARAWLLACDVTVSDGRSWEEFGRALLA